MTKKANSLYELFNCSSKEELYLLVKEKDERVKSLLNYIDYAKGNIGNKNTPINSPETLGKYITSIESPKKNTATIIFTNTKLQPILLERTKVNRKEDIINTIKRGLEAGATRTFLAVGSLSEKENMNMEKLRNMLNTISTNVVDVIHYNENNKTLYSERKGGEVYLTGENFKLCSDEHNLMNYSHRKQYTDFANYYAKEKIKDLDIVKDINEVRKTIKVGYQHNIQEYFGYIAYDKNNKIIKSEDFARGGTDAGIFDPKVLLRELLFIENLKGAAFFHNHPSGNPEPSNEDLDLTEKLMTALEDFNIEYFDHFIVGMEKVFSLSYETPGFESKNAQYQNLCLSRESDSWDLER